MNSYQKYIDELVTTFGPLLKRQLLTLVNHRFKTNMQTLDGYIKQMCSFSDYEEYEYANNVIVTKGGEETNFDIIRSVDVMIEFVDDLTEYNRAKYPVSICFYAETKSHTKEISIIPVRKGTEKGLCEFIPGLSREKCQMVILLLDDRKSIGKFKRGDNILFATVDKNGVTLYRK